MSTRPPRDCALCPRLVAYRQRTASAYPDYYAGAVPATGPASAGLLVVGLAPGLHGAHRTGRAFYGDGSGVSLFTALAAAGFAGPIETPQPALYDCRITNAVKCLPPSNKPTSEELKTCNRYLKNELARPAVVVALGRIAHQAVARAHALPASRLVFGHGRAHIISDNQTLIDAYHCSRYNMNTRRLTPAMLAAVFRDARQRLADARLSRGAATP